MAYKGLGYHTGDEYEDHRLSVEAERSPCEVCGKSISNRGHAQWSHRRSKFHLEAAARSSDAYIRDKARAVLATAEPQPAEEGEPHGRN